MKITIIKIFVAFVVIFFTIMFINNMIIDSAYVSNLGELKTRNDSKGVQMPLSIVNDLQEIYSNTEIEYFYCIMGYETEENYVITSLKEVELISQTETQVIIMEDPPCQISGSIGSIHNHPWQHRFKGFLCSPSGNDLFTFGSMRNPKPLIQIIQCGVDKFYILEMPEKYEPLNYRSLELEII